MSANFNNQISTKFSFDLKVLHSESKQTTEKNWQTHAQIEIDIVYNKAEEMNYFTKGTKTYECCTIHLTL